MQGAAQQLVERLAHVVVHEIESEEPDPGRDAGPAEEGRGDAGLVARQGQRNTTA